MKFGKGMITGLVCGLVLSVVFGAGTVVVTQNGVSKATWDYCTALVSAKIDRVATAPVDLQSDLDTAQATSVEWEEATVNSSACSDTGLCEADCATFVCGDATKSSTVTKVEILQDSSAVDYCSCTCADTFPPFAHSAWVLARYLSTRSLTVRSSACCSLASSVMPAARDSSKAYNSRTLPARSMSRLLSLKPAAPYFKLNFASFL